MLPSGSDTVRQPAAAPGPALSAARYGLIIPNLKGESKSDRTGATSTQSPFRACTKIRSFHEHLSFSARRAVVRRTNRRVFQCPAKKVGRFPYRLLVALSKTDRIGAILLVGSLYG